jgi:RNA polymerase sigma-32 factor
MHLKNDQYPSYFRGLKKHNILTQQEEIDLTTDWYYKKNPKALHKLIMAYSRLIINIANRFRYYGIDMPDLIQEGYVGLLHAAEMFDPNRGVRFSSYARWWIIAYMQDHVMRNWSIVRVGSTAVHKQLFFKLKRLREKISGITLDHIKNEHAQQIAEMLQVTIKDVELIDLRLQCGDASLSSPIGNYSSRSWIESIVDERQDIESACAHLEEMEILKHEIESTLDSLNNREAYIMRARRLKDPPETLDSLSKKLKITKERVRQLEMHGLRKMRSTMLENNTKGRNTSQKRKNCFL